MLWKRFVWFYVYDELVLPFGVQFHTCQRLGNWVVFLLYKSVYDTSIFSLIFRVPIAVKSFTSYLVS